MNYLTVYSKSTHFDADNSVSALLSLNEKKITGGTSLALATGAEYPSYGTGTKYEG